MKRVHGSISLSASLLCAVWCLDAAASADLLAIELKLPPPPAAAVSEPTSRSVGNQWPDLSKAAKPDMAQAADLRVRRITNSGSFRVPGEFERQQALMIACQALHSSDAILDVVLVIQGRIAIVVLCCDEAERQAAHDILSDARISADTIHLIIVPHNTRWTRDYGPVALVSRHTRRIALLDSRYAELERPDDEVVPLALARSASLPLVDVALRIHGGNMLSNGQGLVLTSTAVFEKNDELDRQTVTQFLMDDYGAAQVIFLEPLEDETTGHVDMFATFTSPDSVVIGQYDPRQDDTNAKVLERNAKRLAQVRLPKGRLKVRRIPMPTNEDGIWRTYTNVVYVNGVLLMPVYSNTSPLSQQEAVATYRTLLPSWSIALINADDLIETGGALHCAVMNLGPLSAQRLGLLARSNDRNVVYFRW